MGCTVERTRSMGSGQDRSRADANSWRATFRMMAMTALMMAIALFRVLVVLTGEVWAAYVILGGIFVIAGVFVWRMRSPRTKDANA